MREHEHSLPGSDTLDYGEAGDYPLGHRIHFQTPPNEHLILSGSTVEMPLPHIPSTHYSARICVVAGTLLLLFAGCGNDGPPRVPLSGTVVSDDIAGDLNGTIALLPAAGTSGPAANGLVQEGSFSFSDEDGPVAGPHRVLIDVEPPRGKMDDAENSTLQWKFEFEETVPASAPFELDFRLVREKPDEP